MTPEVAEKPSSRRTKSKVEEQAQDAQTTEVDAQDRDREAAIKENDEALEKLESMVEAKRWIIGRSPELGGKEGQYGIYIQDKLGFMARQRFFALVSRAVTTAIKQSGEVAGVSEMFTGATDMSPAGLIEQGRALTKQDTVDASSFLTVALELVSYSPDFLTECYALWLGVPRSDKEWFKMVIEDPWDPERGYYGLKEEDGIEMIERFIDQNYEDIRRFFAQTLPRLAQRVGEKEKARESESQQSK
jgi:hypothetical protein